MKIIKKGTLPPPPKPPEWVGEVHTCPNCETVFQLERTDLVVRNMVYCPLCGAVKETYYQPTYKPVVQRVAGGVIIPKRKSWFERRLLPNGGE